MKLNIQSFAQSLNKAYLKQSVTRSDINKFKNSYKKLFWRIDPNESEENLKNILSDFLKETYYKDLFEVNTKGRADLVIHNGKTSKDSVGLIIEVKRPSNISEMISIENPNGKAIHEIIHYYFQERIINDNKNIKHLIITNAYKWFIFDCEEFELFFFENKKLKKEYEDWNSSLFGLKQTDWFYQEIAKPFIEKELDSLTCTYFDLRDFKSIIEQESPDTESKIIELYKIFSPEHLLSKPFLNDSNELNKEFYNELLYIFGLLEIKQGGKNIIIRKQQKERFEGSLIENTINILLAKIVKEISK